MGDENQWMQGPERDRETAKDLDGSVTCTRKAVCDQQRADRADSFWFLLWKSVLVSRTFHISAGACLSLFLPRSPLLSSEAQHG